MSTHHHEIDDQADEMALLRQQDDDAWAAQQELDASSSRPGKWPEQKTTNFGPCLWFVLFLPVVFYIAFWMGY